MHRLIIASLLFVACGGSRAGGDSLGTTSGAVGSPCPDPADPVVHYVSPDPLTCAAALFQCDATQTTFDDACGCGCIGPVATPPPPPPPACPDASDSRVHYFSADPQWCAAALFQCSPAQRTFDDTCGCGCID
jgi:hypothetical protein